MTPSPQTTPAPGTPQRLTLVLVNLIHTLGHINFQGIPVLYPLLRDHFGFGYMGIAVLSLVSQLVSGPTLVVFGALTRLARRFHILGVGNALAFIGTLTMALAQGYGALVAGRAVRSLGSSTYHPVGGAVMAASFPNDRAKALGLYQTTGNIGSLAAPLLVGALLHVTDWRQWPQTELFTR